MGRSGPKPRPLTDRFWAKVDKSGECWTWKASYDRYGYGHFRYQGEIAGAHRVAFLLSGGVIPSGLEIDHLCRNRACVNPSHMEPVTTAVNQRRGIRGSATHCVNGHAFDERNTYLRPKGKSGGRRDCRRCTVERQRRYQARKAAA